MTKGDQRSANFHGNHRIKDDPLLQPEGANARDVSFVSLGGEDTYINLLVLVLGFIIQTVRQCADHDTRPLTFFPLMAESSFCLRNPLKTLCLFLCHRLHGVCSECRPSCSHDRRLVWPHAPWRTVVPAAPLCVSRSRSSH